MRASSRIVPILLWFFYGCVSGSTLIIDVPQPVYFGTPPHLHNNPRFNGNIDTFGIIIADYNVQTLYDFFRYNDEDFDSYEPTVYFEDDISMELDSLLKIEQNRFIADSFITLRTWEGIHPVRMLFMIISMFFSSEVGEVEGFDSEENFRFHGTACSLHKGE
jgi:hypothetical protein